MGKRKSSAKAAPKKAKEPLSTTFKCLFCHHEKTVIVKLDRSTAQGSLHCKDCGQKFTTQINEKSVHVDVYADWIDACEELREQQPKQSRPARPTDTLAHGFAGGAGMRMQSADAGRKGLRVGEGVLDDNGDGEDDDDDDDEADFGAKTSSRPVSGRKDREKDKAPRSKTKSKPISREIVDDGDDDDDEEDDDDGDVQAARVADDEDDDEEEDDDEGERRAAERRKKRARREDPDDEDEDEDEDD